jgi:hypothetical protein
MCAVRSRANVGNSLMAGIALRAWMFVSCVLCVSCRYRPLQRSDPLFREVLPGVRLYIYTGLFISPSGISELDCTTTKTHTAERSISIGRESLQLWLMPQLQRVQVVNTGNSWLRKEKRSVDFARGNSTKHIHAIFRHDYPLAVEPASTPRPLVQITWRDSLPTDMLLSAVSVLVVAQSSSEIPEWLMNNPV